MQKLRLHIYYRDPADIRGNSFYRDRWSGDDTFALVLDAFNDNENALWFYVMPLCTRVDLKYGLTSNLTLDATLNMQTVQQGEVPSENFGVLRLRRNVFNRYSNVGGMATSRLGDDGSYNVAYGLDGVVRVFGDEYLTLKWAHTFDDVHLGEPNQPFDAGRLVFNWARRTIRGLSYELNATWSGPAYRPGAGFVSRSDFTLLFNDLDYQWFRGEQSWMRRVWVGHWWHAYLRKADGSLESFWSHPFYWFETKGGATVLLSTEHNYEDVHGAFSLSEDVQVPQGSYWFHDLWLVYNEGFNTNRHQSVGPTLPVTDSRVLLLKYTHTFIW